MLGTWERPSAAKCKIRNHQEVAMGQSTAPLHSSSEQLIFQKTNENIRLNTICLEISSVNSGVQCSRYFLKGLWSQMCGMFSHFKPMRQQPQAVIFSLATSCAPSVCFSCKAWPMGAPWYGLGFLLAGQCCGPPYMSAALAVSSQLLLSAARENRHLPPFPPPRRGLFKQISLMDFSAIKIAF